MSHLYTLACWLIGSPLCMYVYHNNIHVYIYIGFVVLLDLLYYKFPLMALLCLSPFVDWSLVSASVCICIYPC